MLSSWECLLCKRNSGISIRFWNRAELRNTVLCLRHGLLAVTVAVAIGVQLLCPDAYAETCACPSNTGFFDSRCLAWSSSTYDSVTVCGVSTCYECTGGDSSVVPYCHCVSCSDGYEPHYVYFSQGYGCTCAGGKTICGSSGGTQKCVQNNGGPCCGTNTSTPFTCNSGKICVGSACQDPSCTDTTWTSNSATCTETSNCGNTRSRTCGTCTSPSNGCCNSSGTCQTESSYTSGLSSCKDDSGDCSWGNCSCSSCS